MTTIFPVWSHTDRDAMKDLRIAASNFATQIEICEEILPRPDWWDVAQDNIRRSDCVVFIFTSHSAQSRQCEMELAYASSVGKRTLIWTPDLAPAMPEWAEHAEWLSEQAIDAGRAVATTLVMLER